MSQNAIITLVALALIGACAGFVLSTATGKKSDPQPADAEPEPEPEPEPADAEPEPAHAEPEPERRRAVKRERKAARRAVLAQRAATRRAERAAYAEKRTAERFGHSRSLAELDPFAPTVDAEPAMPSSNGDAAPPPSVDTADGLGPAIAFEVEPRAARDTIASLGPAIGTVAAPSQAPASVETMPAIGGGEPDRAAALATKTRPRIFTGEPVPLEPPDHPTRRALKLLGGMTALAAGGAIGVLALARAIAAMFGR